MATKGKAFLASPVSGGGGGVIASPFQFYTTGEDRLLVVAACSVAGVAVKIQARLLDPDGTIRSAVWTHQPNSDRSISSEAFPLNTGAVMNVVLFASGADVQDGQLFAQLFLVRGDGAARITLGQLLGGYCTANQPLGWPGSPIRSSVDGPGAVIQYFATLPAAGSPFVEAVPTGARWQLLRFACGFLASAAVAARVVRLRLLTNVDISALVMGPQSVAASESWFFTFAPGLPHVATVTGRTEQASLPDPAFLRPGDSFDTSTVNIQAGDQFSSGIYVVREWIEVL